MQSGENSQNFSTITLTTVSRRHRNVDFYGLVSWSRLFGPLYENGCDLITNDGYTRKRGCGCPIHKELGDCSSQILKTIPERCQDPVLWAWLVIALPLRGTYSKTKLYLLSHSFSAQYPLKVLQNYKSCAVDLRMNPLRSAVTTFLTPKRYDEPPRSFVNGCLPPPGVR